MEREGREEGERGRREGRWRGERRMHEWLKISNMESKSCGSEEKKTHYKYLFFSYLKEYCPTSVYMLEVVNSVHCVRVLYFNVCIPNNAHIIYAYYTYWPSRVQ